MELIIVELPGNDTHLRSVYAISRENYTPHYETSFKLEKTQQ